MPIITSTGITRDGFVLPPNHSWDAQLINGKKEGIVTVKDEYGRITHVLPFVNDQLNGIAEFYNHGELGEKRTFKNNIEEGWSCEYEREREVRWFMYSNGRKTGELKQCTKIDNFWELFDIKTNSLISICSYDKDHKCIGVGYHYADDHIDRVVMYTSPNVEGLVLKRFNGYEMTEYDDNGNEVYKGGYKDDIIEDYPREGKGKEFINNKLIYEGEFHYNKREGNGYSYKEDKLDYSGEWKNDLPDGNGWMKVDGEVYDGKWVKGRYQVNGNMWYNYSTGAHEEISEGTSERTPDESTHTDATPNQPEKSQNDTGTKVGAGLAATVATGVAGAATHVGGAIASLIGFGSPGIAAGSTAASLMSASATSGVGAGAISAMQSAGALFVNAAGGSVVAAASAIAVPIAAGAVAYAGYRYFFGGSSNETATNNNGDNKGDNNETNNETNNGDNNETNN